MPARFYHRIARATALMSFAACIMALATVSKARAQATITVTRLSDLSFGDVAAGTSTSVLYSDAGASAFRLNAAGMSGFQVVHVTFTLPTQLVNGGDAVPVSFSSTDAAWSYLNDPATATAFDPSVGTDVAKDGNVFTVYVWVGANVNPNGATPAQQYSNTLTLDATIQ